MQARNQDIINSIINNNDDMIFALDLQKRYVLFNDAYQLSMKKRYGVDIEKGKSMLDYVNTPDDVGLCNETFRQVVDGKIVTFETKSKGLYNGHTELHAFPLKDSDEQVFGIAVFARNIAEQAALKKQNTEYVNMMEHIVSDLSHKMRKPVATILGLMQLIDSEKENTDLHKILDYLKESTAELDDCIRQMTSLIQRKPGN